MPYLSSLRTNAQCSEKKKIGNTDDIPQKPTKKKKQRKPAKVSENNSSRGWKPNPNSNPELPPCGTSGA
jgi:hypothetical protein